MRHAIQLNGMIVTTDNSGGIGEKKADLIFVKDEVTAKFAARVALLEQWAANAEPSAILIHNFSGEQSWGKYVQGIADLFREIGIEVPTISGSTETNMPLNQSALAVTMIGEVVRFPRDEELRWFTYGTPLVGDEVIEQTEKIASVQKIYEAFQKGLIERIWPVGSCGILHEVRMLTRNDEAIVKSIHNTAKSAGPATVILMGVKEHQRTNALAFFGDNLQNLSIELN